MGRNSEQTDDIVEVAGKVVVVGIIILFFVVIFLCCLHLYFKWFYRQETNVGQRQRRRQRQQIAIVDHDHTIATNGGLEAGVLKSIPIVVLDSNEFKDGLECAVCLSEVSEGEKARILPKCNHGFHVDCIDMWFHSHATCPLCRNPIIPIPPSHCHEDIEDEDDSSSSSSSSDHVPAAAVWGDATATATALAPNCVEPEEESSTSAAMSLAVVVVMIDNIPLGITIDPSS